MCSGGRDRKLTPRFILAGNVSPPWLTVIERTGFLFFYLLAILEASRNATVSGHGCARLRQHSVRSDGVCHYHGNLWPYTLSQFTGENAKNIRIFVDYRMSPPKRPFFVCCSSRLKLGQSLWRWCEFLCAYVSPSVSESHSGFSLAWFESAQPTFSFLGPVTRLDWLRQNSTAL